MPIRKIQFAPGEFYHVYNRGNAKQNIFSNEKDMYRFLQAIYLSNSGSLIVNIDQLERSRSGYTLADMQRILEENKVAPNVLVKICSDCLMPNHFHLLLQEIKEGGITEFMHRLGTSYAKYFVKKYERPGSLFQGRFKAVHIENHDQLKYLLAYINAINPAQLEELNLKEAGIQNVEKVLEKINDYKWSTHFEFLGKRKSILVDETLLNSFFDNPKNYYEFVKEILIAKSKKLWAVVDGSTLE